MEQMNDLAFIDADDKARREHQLYLERLFNKNQLIPRIRNEFKECEAINFSRYFRICEINEEFGYNLLVQMVLHKRTTVSTLVGILRHHFEPDSNASQLAADGLVKALRAKLVLWNENTKQFVINFNISDDVQVELDRFQFPLPMVVKPRVVRDNSDTGYFTARNSVILRKNHHEEDVCLDHINRVNRIKFSLDIDTANMIANRWRNLDKPKMGESQEEFQKRVKAFEKYDRSAKEVMSLILAHGNEFYLTHKYDKRGRVYCQGYHVNYQGAPWNKAVIELADKEYVE